MYSFNSTRTSMYVRRISIFMVTALFLYCVFMLYDPSARTDSGASGNLYFHNHDYDNPTPKHDSDNTPLQGSSHTPINGLVSDIGRKHERKNKLVIDNNIPDEPISESSSFLDSSKDGEAIEKRNKAANQLSMIPAKDLIAELTGGWNTKPGSGNAVGSSTATSESGLIADERKDTRAASEKCVKRLPQAIIVGVMKGGTMALMTFLNEHPNVVACMKPSETKYFTYNYKRGIAWYRSIMPCSYSDQITIEKTPAYFYSNGAAAKIKELNPATKIIIVVKDPVERAVSHFAMVRAITKRPNKDRPPFGDVVTNNHKSVKGSIYISYSNYDKNMARWLQYFDLDQICIVDGENLVKNPAEELTKVENYLNIPNYFTPDHFWYNATKGKYCLKTGDNASCLDKGKGRPHPTIDENDRLLLQQHFKPRNERFFELIKRRFDWGY